MRVQTAVGMLGVWIVGAGASACDLTQQGRLEVRNVNAGVRTSVTAEVRYEGPQPSPSEVRIAYLLDDVVVLERTESPRGTTSAEPMTPGRWYRIRYEEMYYRPLELRRHWNGVQFSATTKAGPVRCERCGPFRWN